MRALIIISLYCLTARVYAHKPVKPTDQGDAATPACERHILNVADLHDSVKGLPNDSLGLNGAVTVDAPVTWQTLARAATLSKFVMLSDHRGAYVVQPARRAFMDVPGFRNRIPRRHRRYLRQLLAPESGFTITHDRAFERVVAECKRAPRRDRENRVDRPARSWITDDLEAEFVRAHFHPDRLAHSVEVWFGKELVAGLFLTFFNGVPMGESMFFNRAYGDNIGKLALYALLERLEAAGHPRLDLQSILNTELSLPYLWGAYFEDRVEHDRLNREHQDLNLEYSKAQ